MYHDLKCLYWWDDMKKDIAEFVAQCPNCQQVKVEHPKPRGLLQEMDIPTWKWDMAPYESLYGRKCRSPIGWFEVGETNMISPDMIQEVVDKVKLIQDRLLVAQSQQKSYTDNRYRHLEFQVGDWAFLKVSPMKYVMRFGRKGKLSPRYIGPYQIVHRVGQVAYELELLANLEAVHPVFHVSILRKCIGDPYRVFPIDDVQVTGELSYEY
ncbi:uncharacterized protein LOC129894762 [Solanum dulcamara]|uniref:uncharacterized protein LOC129894762 n=1 Tax=Solanum dulcamara TaxID=45834 RepID=UPI002484E3C0|nr:uncharacterized protein LOC129894762 [Solanum dulcamara]